MNQTLGSKHVGGGFADQLRRLATGDRVEPAKAAESAGLGTFWEDKQTLAPATTNENRFDFDVPILGSVAWVTIRVLVTGVAFSGFDVLRTDVSLAAYSGTDGYDPGGAGDGYGLPWPTIFLSGVPVGAEYPAFGGQTTVLMRRPDDIPGTLATNSVTADTNTSGPFGLIGATVSVWAHTIVAAQP